MESQSSKKRKAQRHLVLFSPTPSLLSPSSLSLTAPPPSPSFLPDMSKDSTSSTYAPNTSPGLSSSLSQLHVVVASPSSINPPSPPSIASTSTVLPDTPPTDPGHPPTLPPGSALPIPLSPSGEEILLSSHFLDVGAELIMTFLSLFLFLLPFSFPFIPSTAISCVLQSQIQTSNFEDTAGISHSRCWEGFPSRRERESRLRW